MSKKLLVVLGCSLLLLLRPSVAFGDEPNKNVLVFYSDGLTGPPAVLVNHAIRSTLKEGSTSPIQIYFESLDSFRVPTEEYDAEMVKLLQRKYEGVPLDVIFAISNPALRFLVQHRSELFSNVPIVFLVNDERRVADLDLRSNMTGVWGKVELSPTLDIALASQPETQRVVVTAGNATIDRDLMTLAQKEFRAYEGRVSLTYLTDMTVEEVRQHLAVLPDKTVVIFLNFNVDRTGKRYFSPDVVSQLASTSHAPIYASAEIYLGQGIVGGRLLSYEALGLAAGQLGLRILAGESAQSIAPQTVPSVTMFDWRQLRRWRVDEAKLPPGSIVRYKEFSVWELYKWRIVGAVVLIILQALLILWLLANRAKRRKAEEASKLSETRYRNVVETQTELICRYQPDTTLTFVNDAYCRYFGKSSEQLIGTKFSELLPEHARDAALAHIASLIENPRAENYEHEVVLPNGETGWQEWVDHVAQSTNGGGIELQGIGRDITERRQAEEELRLSETRFRHMADTSEIFIWIADVNMLCTYFNRRVLDFTGRTMDQLVGEGWLGIIHQDDVQRCVDMYTAGYQKREPFVLEFRIRRADGEYRWIYDTGSPRLAADGELIGYIGSAVDITDRKVAEESLQLAHEEVSKLKNQLEAENIYLQEEIRLTHNVDEIVGESNAIKYVLFKIEQVAQTETSVLVLGETGTGKELVARAIHSQSTRKDRPLVKVNCAALSASLIESELFGHEKGSFTGATSRKIGRFELADGATIFLDEIGELPLELQPKLLRVIQEGEIERLGSSKTIKVNVRLIAATNRNLKEEVEKGTFREDLWYRLNVFPITLPPLRQRKEDIPLMVEHFARVFSKKVGKTITSISSATLKKFHEHSWPGNVRELSNVVERALVTTQGTVLHVADQFEQAKDLPELIKTLEEIEKDHITRILEQTAWRVEGPSGAARILGLNPSTLRTRMGKLGIQKSIRSFAQSSKQQN